MGVDAYQTNQTSLTTFSASQSAAPVEVPPPQPVAAPLAESRPSAMKFHTTRSCAALRLGAAPPPHQVPPPEQKSGQILSRVDIHGRDVTREGPSLRSSDCMLTCDVTMQSEMLT